jgi:hypothetical protein
MFALVVAGFVLYRTCPEFRDYTDRMSCPRCPSSCP